MRRWLKGEPKLKDMLADPVIALMMQRDRVDPDRLRAFLQRLGEARVGTDLRPVGFAEPENPTEDALAR